uniref:Uncharacterized protein n=1 Tax=Chromera velia CCMP2878 TaxID=1169474 RepID=A0A0G4GDW4_9ALVE|eukprot:Cvel_21438.t1-p1 / transcript=Cvel_21438.t1 / gene=Cvel_21438 / organism=Chromera_velia_CCMP2878 / gene_product=hypothetical protein / transcript_product=hypothetical protein / location=Cvel_scaffold2010:3614-7561(+) / protein_length=122 / sequence_SO=supercontig / SO=protein_coding / is_pseudo=false
MWETKRFGTPLNCRVVVKEPRRREELIDRLHGARFFTTLDLQVVFLGLKISRTGVRPERSKTEQIRLDVRRVGDHFQSPRKSPPRELQRWSTNASCASTECRIRCIYPCKMRCVMSDGSKGL